MSPPNLRPGSIVRGPTLPEPVEVLALVPLGDSVKIIGRGLQTGLTHDPVLTPDQVARLTVSADREPFDGDARLFRLGVEAHRLGLAYEYDPFFSLSIARVDPLPHQLEAVYHAADHLVARIRPRRADPGRLHCRGPGRLPPLAWSGVPAGAKALALIVDDPDAPDPKAPKRVWVHWVLDDLHSTATDLPAGTREVKNDWGRTGYGGPM